MVRVGILVLFLILEKSFQLFTVEYDVSCQLVMCGLYYVEVHPLDTHIFESFFFLRGKCKLCEHAFYFQVLQIC